MATKPPQDDLARRAAEAELARLIAEQAADAKGHVSSSASKKVAATLAKHDAGGAMQEPLTEVRTNAPTPHRDVAEFGPRPRERAGTQRLVFRDTDGSVALVLHAGQYMTDSGTVDIHGAPMKEPVDWAEAAADVIVGAKFTLLSYLDGIRDVAPEQRRGTPDPRGPSLRPGETLIVTESGVFVQRDHMAIFYGNGEAVPAAMLMRIRATGKGAPPAWLTEALLAWLVQLASSASGGAGQLSKRRLVELLRAPDKLSRYLQKHVGTSRELRSIALSLPRKRPRRRRA